MSEASVVFLPWVRQGLAARIGNVDPLATALPTAAALATTLAVNGSEIASMPLRLHGPADVIGLDPRQVVRTEPPTGTSDYESNDLAAIEFDNPDLPWLFTPAAADAQGRLRPWLVLVVVRRQDGVRLRAPREEPLPVLEIAAPARPADELPDLADSWAWAHAQLGAPTGASEAELRALLATRPELSVSRLLSPRLLEPFTDYLACVVPAFESGRRAGLGEAVEANAPLAPAWTSAAAAPARVALPVYYHWEFRTGAREDFESIIARLAPRDLADVVGRRPMDIGRPGFAVPALADATLLLEGALQPMGAPRSAWPDPARTAWHDTLQRIVNAANARSTPADAEPVLGPPIYGRWYAGRHQVGTGSARTWLDELNLDPRERVVAALGTRVIQQQQEALVAEAWEQAGEIAQANQQLKQMQLALTITSRLHGRHVLRLDGDDALWRFAAPAQARLIMPGATAEAARLSMRSTLAASSTPQVTTSAAMRRLTRPRGAINRRALGALAAADLPPATAGKPAIGSLFRLFGGEPRLVMFRLPPTRGMVSFDAVTRRLPPEHAGITYAKATDAAVAEAQPRPIFVVGQPRTPPVIDVITGGVFIEGTLHATRAKPRPSPNGGDEPPDVEPPPPHPPPPPPPPPPIAPFDSADAMAFREAARRHLARVNPRLPFLPLEPFTRAVLNTAALQEQVRALLDPAPTLQRRMAAMIRVGAEGATLPAIGPVGYSPVFAQPMSEALAALSQDWLLPGLDRVPPDSVALLEPNQRFIEAFMLGLNAEMGSELLWRDYPLGDPRATYFRRFWRGVNPRGDADIAPIAQWGEGPLGGHAADVLSTAASGGSAAKQLVLLVRSALFRRYPNAVVYAVPAVPSDGGRMPGAQAAERHPLFRGALQPDVSFFGFELDATEAIADPGWYFVIQQQPTEPRFGFDVEVDFGGATHVPLAAPPTGHALPPGTQWARNAAHIARITRQQPVRVAIHASELIARRA